MSELQKVMNPVHDGFYSISGLAVLVKVWLKSEDAPDALQAALLDLLNLRTYDDRTLAEMLGMEDCGFVSKALQDLEASGMVECNNGLYQTVEREETDGSNPVLAWAVWDPVNQTLLPELLDFENKAASDAHLREIIPIEERLERATIVESLRNLQASKLLRLCRLLPSKEHNHELDPEIRENVGTVSIIKQQRRIPLSMRVCIHGGLDRDNAYFYYRPLPQILVGHVALEHVYRMRDRIRDGFPQIMAELRTRAELLNQEYMKSLCGKALDEYGGIEKIRKRAQLHVQQIIEAYPRREALADEALIKFIHKSEVEYQVWKCGVSDESGVRGMFDNILTGTATRLGDFMGKLLSEEELDMAYKKFLSDNGAKLSDVRAKNLVDKLCMETGISFGPFDLARHLKNIGSFKAAYRDEGNRGQLGSAMLIWLIPLVYCRHTPPGEKHLKWVKHVLGGWPDFLAVFHELTKIRNSDKKVRDSGDRRLEDIRSEVMGVWDWLSRE